MIYKPFKQRVKEHLLKENWNIQYSSIPYITFFSVRRGTKMKKAYCVKPHGHLLHKVQNALYEYGRAHKIHVIYIHETAGHEMEFIRVYPRNLKTEVIEDERMV